VGGEEGVPLKSFGEVREFREVKEVIAKCLVA
jgi:hypothetical protein